ncbi:hypothetical protein PROVRETT_05517 [Providencia rettgeri DSM 1131]|uniref:hypothetical protein n=1 Tax=Providencia rettgeri TaxID=587 RepID=UPI000197C479|nr:hypothetical protein PROVRETT_05517 [Providencia rettgeri DSM 1131]QXA59956.1 hypothetical protein I6L79_10870 [Providencia rettgeri]
MPIVPTYKEQQVSSSPLPNTGFSVQSNPNQFGAGLGQVAEQYAGVFAEAKQRADVALSQDALLQLQEYSDDLMNNPKTGLYTKLGRNAMGQSDETLNNIRSKAGELMDSLPEGRSREDFLKQSNVLWRQYHNQAKTFELRETQSFETSVNNGLVEGNLKNAQDSYSDPQAFNSYIALAEHNYVEFNRARGVSDEEISVNVEKIRNGAAWGAAQNYMASAPVQALSAIGEPSDVGGSKRVPGNLKDNRGGRNNNPGNLRISDNVWDGQIGDDGEFVQFASPEHGVRALGKNLITYRNKGFVTVNQIINRWAPKKDGNDTEGYVTFVSQHLSVDPNTPIDVTNIDTLKDITVAIMQKEGKHSVSDDQINTGVQAALGLTRLSDVDKSQYQPEIRKAQGGGFPWWPMLTPVQQYQLIKQGEAAQNKQRQEYKSVLDGKVKDAEALALRGESYSNPPSLDEFKYAHGENDGIKEYEQFQKNMAMGADIATVQYLSPQAQTALLESKKPKGDYDAANNYKRYDTLARAIDTVNKVRASDPIQFSIDRQQVNQLDFSSIQNFTNSLTQRSSNVGDISKNYQTPLTVFSAQEELVLSQLMEKAPASQKIEYLDAIRQGLKNNESYTAALRQVSKSDTSLAVAGVIMNKPTQLTVEYNKWSSDIVVTPQQAAQLIVQGSTARKSGKDFVLPKDTELREEFADFVGDVFAGDIDGANSAYEVAKDAYAGMMAKNGNINGEYDKDIWQQAINIATGGIYDFNGRGKVMLPWGMDGDTFKKQVKSELKYHEPEIGNISVDIIGMQSLGDSQYLIKRGSGYLLYKDGTPVIIDLTREKIRDIPL